jgi:hypothetical protein
MRTKDGADPLFSYDAMGWHAGTSGYARVNALY